MYLRSGRVIKTQKLVTMESGLSDQSQNDGNNTVLNVKSQNDCNNSCTEYVPPFSSEDGMIFSCWLKLFESYCSKLDKNEEWKLQNVGRFLKGEALTVFINSACVSWSEIVESLKEKFISCDIFGFSDFTDLKLERNTELVSYFHKKLELGRKLGLSNKIVLEGLTDGLPMNVRALLTLQPPASATEWLNMASKLVKVQDDPKTVTITPKLHENSNNDLNIVNKISTPRPYTPRFTNYRAPYIAPSSYQPSWRPRNGGVMTRDQNPNSNWPRFGRFRPPTHGTPRQYLHCQQQLPRTPCKICERQGILHAYHWENTCPLKTNGPTMPIQSVTPSGHCNTSTISPTESQSYTESPQ